VRPLVLPESDLCPFLCSAPTGRLPSDEGIRRAVILALDKFTLAPLKNDPKSCSRVGQKLGKSWPLTSGCGQKFSEGLAKTWSKADKKMLKN